MTARPRPRDCASCGERSSSSLGPRWMRCRARMLNRKSPMRWRASTVHLPIAQFLRGCVLARLNIVVTGGTGSGKTTLLNALSACIPDDERIVTIEDAAELRLAQDHVITLEAKRPAIDGTGEVTIRDLVRN